MNTRIPMAALAGVALLVSAGAAAPPPPPPTAEQVAAALTAARDDPANSEKLRAALAVLPKINIREGGATRHYYVFEGDQLLTEKQVGIALEVLNKRKDLPRSPELNLLNINGKDVILAPGRDRALTYAVDRASFPSAAAYQSVVRDIQSAAAEWVDACRECGVSFTHLAALDKERTFTGATFVVRYDRSVTKVVASSYFPNDPPYRRTLIIAPGFFGMNYARDGVLRHELGHILGYRHEHLSQVSGCSLDPETNDWRPIGEYDPDSVMHYMCGRGGNYELHLSATDRTLHRKIYLGGTTS